MKNQIAVWISALEMVIIKAKSIQQVYTFKMVSQKKWGKWVKKRRENEV